MESCLQPLWDILYNDMAIIMNNETPTEEHLKAKYIEEQEAAISRIDKILKSFFIDIENVLMIEKPAHIETFTKGIEQYQKESIDDIISMTKQAKIEAKECKLCAVCTKCAEKFYDSVCAGKITEKGLPYELGAYFESNSQIFYYQKGTNHKRERESLENKLLLLKGFSSSTPRIHSAIFDGECFGGGFYLNYEGIGIVIDPGIDFVLSMHKRGIYITDINVVIITHDHLDHNADAETISSLAHDLNKYNSSHNKIVREVFELESPKKHEIQWIVDDATGKRLKDKISVDDATGKQLETKISNVRYLRDFTYLENGDKNILDDKSGIQLSSIRTKHIKDSDDSFGIRITAKYGEKKCIIGYTSDTAYFEELCNFFAHQDILIFNVSDLYKKDVRGLKDKNSHLGYNGSVKLLKKVNFGIGIASEFCCTNGDFRMNFIHLINNELDKENSCVIPGEIGLNISVPELYFECSICRKKIQRKDMRVLAPKKQYGDIQYICGQCAVNVIK